MDIETFKDLSNKNAIAFFVTAIVAWYVYQTPGCEAVMNSYLTGMFGIATGYYMGKSNGTK